MKIDDRTMRLIAVGASVAANCQSCLQTNINKACQEGIDAQDIAEAIELGKMVWKGAASKMDKFIQSLNQPTPSAEDTGVAGCGCTS